MDELDQAEKDLTKAAGVITYAIGKALGMKPDEVTFRYESNKELIIGVTGLQTNGTDREAIASAIGDLSGKSTEVYYDSSQYKVSNATPADIAAIDADSLTNSIKTNLAQARKNQRD